MKNKKRSERRSLSRKTEQAGALGVAPGSEFVPMELAPTPDLGDESISELKRAVISDEHGERDGISFMVDLPPGISGTEICLTNGQLKQLLDFGRWKRVPRKLNTPNNQSSERA